MANSRYYSSVAQQTTLTSGVTNSGTTIMVAATAGFPGSTPYTLALDYGAANEELVSVTNVAGLTLTVTRAYDGTSGSSHNPGAVVRHVSSAIDFTDSRTHEASSSGVHGVTGAVVGTSDTQSLSNKTLVRAVGSLQNITAFNVGASGITTIVGDSTNPNASRLEIKDNEVALNTLIFFQSTGAIKSVKTSGETDGSYKIRITDNDGTTDRVAVLAGGTVTVTPTSSTTFPALDVVAPSADGTKRIIRVAASGGGTERFTVFNDGRLAIVAQQNAQNALKVTSAATPSVDIVNVSDSTGSNTLFAVQSTGKFLGNKGGTIAQPGVTTGAVLQVGGSNVGYTGNLEQWVGPANSIVASVDHLGNFNANDFIWTGGATWVAYGAVWGSSGTQPNLGNGTMVARYKQFGKTVIVSITMTAGNTTTFGTGNYTFTLPFTSANLGATMVGTAQLLPSGGSRWPGQAQIGPNSTTVSPFFATAVANATLGNWTPTAPETFNNLGVVRLTFTYEIA